MDKQIKFYAVVVAPVFMYRSENWALNRSERRKVVTAEIRFLKRVSGYALTDHVRNATMRSALQIYDLN
jgi:hypothetical protein